MNHRIEVRLLLCLMLLAGCDRSKPDEPAPQIELRDKVFDAAGEMLLTSLDPSADRRDNNEVAKALIRIVCAHDPTIDAAAAAAVMAAPLRDAYPPFTAHDPSVGSACGRFFDASQEYVGEALRKYRLQHPSFRQALPPPPLPQPPPWARFEDAK